MKVVIEIDEETYIGMINNEPYFDYESILKATKNGTPLPEDFSLEDYERYKKDSENLSWIKCPDRMGN